MNRVCRRTDTVGFHLREGPTIGMFIETKL